MSKPLRVLIVEDSEDDAELLVRELCRGGYKPQHARVDTAAAMTDALVGGEWEVILADYYMPHFDALAALQLARDSGRDLPFIIVSGTIGEDIAVEAMKAGAHDYLVKGHLARLVPAVERELREAEVRRARRRTERELLESQLKFEALLENSPHAVVISDRQGRIVLVNRETERHLRLQPRGAAGPKCGGADATAVPPVACRPSPELSRRAQRPANGRRALAVRAAQGWYGISR